MFHPFAVFIAGGNKVFQAIKYGVTVWCNAGKGENMNSKNKQRISLYLDKETVEKMDSAIKKYGYRSRNDFVSSAVDNLVADRLLGENDTVISEKLSKATLFGAYMRTGYAVG